MTEKSITGVVEWLKGWFFDKDEITSKEQALQTQINNKASQADLNTTNTNVSNLSSGKVDKSNGASQMTDSSAYSNLGTSANATQKTINNAINTKIAQKNVTVEEQSAAEEGFLKTYVVKQNGTQVGSKINIPKDFLVKSASVKQNGQVANPTIGVGSYEKYLDFVVNTRDNSGTDEHIYIPLLDIIDVSSFSNTYAPVYHANSSSNFGLGTSSLYGHVKLVNALTSKSFRNGEALSAYQGKVLADKIEDIKDTVSATDATKIKYTPSQNVWGEGSQVVTTVAYALTYLMEEANLKANKSVTISDIQLVPKSTDDTGAIKLIYADN